MRTHSSGFYFLISSADQNHVLLQDVELLTSLWAEGNDDCTNLPREETLTLYTQYNTLPENTGISYLLLCQMFARVKFISITFFKGLFQHIYFFNKLKSLETLETSKSLSYFRSIL